MNKNLLLNDFEIRYVVNAFSKFNVVNLLPYLNDSRELCYVIFYKYNDIYFTESVTFCQNTQMSRQERLSEFLEYATEHMTLSFKSIAQGLFSSKSVIKKSEYSYVAKIIFLNVKFNYIYFVKTHIVEHTRNHNAFDYLEEEALSLLKRGFCAKDILLDYFDRFGLNKHSIVKKINTLWVYLSAYEALFCYNV